MDSLTILWVILSVLMPKATAVAPGMAGDRVTGALTARLLQIQQSGSPCTFESSRPAASDDDNTGDEDDSGGSAAGCVALRSSVSMVVPALAHTHWLPSQLPYPRRTAARELSSRAPPLPAR
jgi:hypothetical protein